METHSPSLGLQLEEVQPRATNTDTLTSEGRSTLFPLKPLKVLNSSGFMETSKSYVAPVFPMTEPT
jgi:hypothetical protein